jgi:hypothetical protein
MVMDCRNRNLIQIVLFGKRIDKEPMSKKNKRAFQRVSSGHYLARLRNKKIRMITLTSSDVAVSENYISRDVDVLIKRIRRKQPDFQYWKVNVFKNGRWHVHMLYVGKFLTKKWLSYNWNSIHNSYIVDVCFIDDSRSVASYVANQYLSNQEGEFTRMSYSQKWLFKGAVGVWKNICKAFRNCDYKKAYFNEIFGCWVYPVDIKKALKEWYSVLSRYADGLSLYPTIPAYTSLSDYG